MGLKSGDADKTIKVTATKNNIADLIANGILLDYSNTEFDDN